MHPDSGNSRTPDAEGSRSMAGVYRNVLAVSLLATIWPSLALGQATKAGVVTNLQGNVTAARTTQPQPVPLNIGPNTFATATGALVNSGPMTQAMHNGAWGGLTISGVQAVNGGQDGARDTVMGATVATFSTGLPNFTPPAIPPPPGPNTNAQNLILPGGAQSLPSLQTLPTLPQLPVNNPNGPPVHGGVGGNLNGPLMRPPINGPFGSASSTCRPVAW